MPKAVYYLAQQDGGHEAAETAGAAETHAETGADHGGGDANIFEFQPNLSAYTTVAFFLVLFGLYRLVPRILETLDQRAEKIEGDLKGAEEAKTDAEKLQAQYEQQLADAHGEGRHIVDEARQRAEAQAREIIATAQSEAASLKQKAQEELDADRARAVKDLRGEIADLSCSVAGRLIEQEMSAEAHRALIDRFIDELTANDASRN